MTVRSVSVHSGARGRGATAAMWSLALASVVLLVAAIVLDQVCRARGLRDALLLTGPSLAFFIAILGALSVGAVVSIRRPTHPVGWLIWFLGLSILIADLVVAYAAVGLVGKAADLPGAGIAAGVANAAFVPWLMFLTLILALTPSGTLPARWGRPFAIFCVGAAAVFFVTRLLRPGLLDAPLDSVRNTLGVEGGWVGVLSFLQSVSALAVNLGLLTSIVLLISRFRRSVGDDRARLTWVAASAVGIAVMVPIPAIALAGLTPSAANVVVSVVVGTAFTLFVLGIGTGVLRYRLYDVDRVLSTGTAYLLLTMVVVAVFVVVTLGLSQIVNGQDSSPLRVGASTLAAAGAAGVLRRRVQDLVDRRFHRRRYEAVAVMRAFLTGPQTGNDAAEVALREATGDQSIRVGYTAGRDRQSVLGGRRFLL